ncbi:hypothetical protein LTR91_016832 [Friedmanniomyces endolithicus]|uniref:Uncharacterized protein n=1 Tax=Friedmanniomyces endolithicus TaxID=329885 RepID=A0AAN6QK38_9PEZI|nr:hypothetical protein LTR94_003296 [Friedmanniomyces endolithicus]KAK0787820.1 hypothetical protein LTR38_011520 [Friedmanniomyces endolithicus]KAK0891741.1 hypothetical protein LTR02_013848 [Friedmanniomyces endolithicus]KAK0968211.1 hypothetical protein LTR91_016832 [Friedmanniomyces endolithicus]KAK1031165.1 hypothetical protein LTS16_018301 [Friedmanniomyces endolithicus]
MLDCTGEEDAVVLETAVLELVEEADELGTVVEANGTLLDVVPDAVEADSTLAEVDADAVEEESTLLLLDTGVELEVNVGTGNGTTGGPPAHGPLYAAREPLTVFFPETELSSVQDSPTLIATQPAVVSQRAWQLSMEATVACRL